MSTLKLLRSQCLKELDLQPLQDLWEDAKVSFDSDHYHDAIEDLTGAVAEIEQNVLAVTLLKRAMAYAFRGRIQAGIKDAYRVMKLAPKLFEGYLCAGRLLQLSGEYGKAVAVYTEGIGAVSGQCAEYEQLIQVKRAVEYHIHQTNTVLFKRLPFELLAYIFGDLLPFKDRLKCTFICHAWQEFILCDLPRVSRRVILGNMSKSFMEQLSQNVSTSHQGDLPTRDPPTYQVTILADIGVSSLRNALNTLSQDSWSARISYLDICVGLNYKPKTKFMLDKLLQQNSGTLKRLIMCNVADIQTNVDALNKCSSLSHLVVSSRSPLIANDDLAIITYHGTVIANSTHSLARMVVTGDIDRERLLPSVRNPAATGNPILPAEQQRIMREQQRIMHGQHMAMLQRQRAMMEQHRLLLERQRDMQQGPTSNLLQAHHLALKRLELVRIRTGFLINSSFWEHLPNLEHFAIKDPLRVNDDLRSIAQNVGKYCLKLKTFRYGTGWEDSFRCRNGVISVVESTHEQEDGIREIIVRAPSNVNTGGMKNAMIVPSLVLENKNCTALLTTLVLQMETIGATELQTLTNLHIPRLKEFQLHQYLHGESYKIRPKHFAPISKNFPALEKIILNNVQACGDTIFELSKAQKLRCAHLRVVNVPHLDSGFGAQGNVAANYAPPAAWNMEPRPNNDALANAIAALNAGHVQHNARVVRNPYLDRYYDTSLNVYTEFIKSSTMLTEVCLCGPTVQDADLRCLVANNRNLSTINLIHCRSLTTSGISSAFNCARDGVSPAYLSSIHQITFANVPIAAETVVSSLAGLSSLQKLTIIDCGAEQDSENSIAAGLKYNPSRQSVLQIYCLHGLTSTEGILYECIPGQPSVMIRSVPSIPIVKHVINFL